MRECQAITAVRMSLDHAEAMRDPDGGYYG